MDFVYDAILPRQRSVCMLLHYSGYGMRGGWRGGWRRVYLAKEPYLVAPFVRLAVRVGDVVVVDEVEILEVAVEGGGGGAWGHGVLRVRGKYYA